MPVAFSAAQSRVSTPANVMSQLHTTLLAAGWELVYADADAIGTGTASSPAWSKAYASGASIGLAVYRMPAIAGFATRWCVELNPTYGTAAGVWYMKSRTATDSTGAGVLTSPGSVLSNSTSSSTSTSTSTEWYVNAYEHGFAIGVHVTGSGWLWGIERRRTLAGVILDDLVYYACGQSASTVTLNGVVSTGYNGATNIRVAGAGEQTPQRWVVFADSSGTTPFTLNRMDGTSTLPQGPFNVTGGTAGFPRLFSFYPANDASNAIDLTVTVDGANHIYAVSSAMTGIMPAGTLHARIAYARD
ncbi:hypothetical protein [uncultured Deinococcus sp.]|uniref:hypothetical protein n=1 Tax=uncultured Deinococcus sp. TaxID=158789 RepID=UPI0025FBEDAB|nr:hypothetical protein [uncultured Deinococcus sp.]